MKQLAKLFEHTLMDIYYAENQILKALPKLAKGAEAAELKEAFKTHLGQTREQIERLEQIFEMLGKPAKGAECEAIKGILKEGDKVFDKFHGSSAQDAGMIAAAQAVENYEIARYGALRTWAQDLGMDDAAGLLEATLSEERETDDLLSSLAESRINADAT